MRRTFALLAVLALVTTGCGPAVQHESDRPVHYDDYVALGDTFTAAPYTSHTAHAHGCRRASDNYPSLVAKALHVQTLDDRSCTGADVRGARKGQLIGKHTVAPQLDALTRRTDLVTIGLGAYQKAMYTNIATVCAKGDVYGCRMLAYEPHLDLVIDTVRQSLDRLVREVQSRSPHATIVLVDYPRFVSVTKTCSDVPGTPTAKTMHPKARQAWNDVVSSIDLQVTRAASDTGADIADVYGASKGHDLCSSDPWVRPDRTSHAKGIALGPTAAEQRAVARLVEKTLAIDERAADGAS